MSASLLYLESLDSVRVNWDRWNQNGGDTLDLQIFGEVFLSVALGRQIVVPQSYALDSMGFVSVAETVLAARDNAFKSAQRPTPFRLHLYKTDSFRTAIQMMLRSADRRDEQQFFSSLIPSLNSDESATKGSRIANRIESRGVHALLEALDNETDPASSPSGRSVRREGLRRIWDEFAIDEVTTSKIEIPPDTRTTPSLTTAVADLVTSSSTLHRALIAAGYDDDEEFQRLVESLIVLNRHQPHPDDDKNAFRGRSSIHADAPWPNHPERRSARQLLEADKKAYPVVLEFVDSYYNAVVSSSVGFMPTLYSTSITLGTNSAFGGSAQDIALIAANRAAPADEQSGDDGAGRPNFEVFIEPGIENDASAEAETIRDLRKQAADSFEAIFEAYRDPGFRQSARDFARASMTGDERAYMASLTKHVDLTARHLAGSPPKLFVEDQAVMFGLEATIGGGATFSQGKSIGSALLGIAGPGVVHASNYLRRRSRHRAKVGRYASAMGRFIDPRARGTS